MRVETKYLQKWEWEKKTIFFPSFNCLCKWCHGKYCVCIIYQECVVALILGRLFNWNMEVIIPPSLGIKWHEVDEISLESMYFVKVLHAHSWNSQNITCSKMPYPTLLSPVFPRWSYFQFFFSSKFILCVFMIRVHILLHFDWSPLGILNFLLQCIKPLLFHTMLPYLLSLQIFLQCNF